MKKNLLFSFIYEGIVAIYPIVLIPYLSITIGKEGIGIYSYTYSILGFFLLFCQLGVNTCGTRAIAQTRENPKKMTITFKSIYFIQLVSGVLSTIIFLNFFIYPNSEYKLYYILLLPYIIGQSIRISWFFLGLSQIKTILIRNVIIRLVSAICILIFVKTQEDLPLYFAFMSLSYLLGDVLVWPVALKKLTKDKFSMNETLTYVKPMIIMFLPVLALRGAYYIDEIMLGYFRSKGEVGIYENAYKIVNMPLQLYTVLANVLTAEASNLVANNKQSENEKIIIYSIDISSCLMFFIIFSIISTATQFVPWYMKSEFIDCVKVLKILPFVLIFSGINSILRTQYYIPMNQDIKYVSTIILGIVINFILNLLLVNNYSYVGVAVATCISEMIISFISTYIVSRKFNVFEGFRYIYIYIIAGIITSTVNFGLGSIFGIGILTNIFQMFCGSIVYFGTVMLVQLFFFKNDDTSFYKIISNMFRNKFIRVKEKR